MSKHNKSNKEDHMKLSKKRLLPEEYRKYKQIGEPDLSQNWLELFTPVIVSDLFEIMHSCSDNPRKAGYIREEMEYYGFEEVNIGTNIYTMANPAYPGVVFKFALDDNGLADNFNDTILQDLVPRYARTLARHPSAIVSVQERKVVVADQDRMDTFRNSILKTLGKLAEDFLVVDLSPSIYHLNYGIERNGDWCFIDASDLYPTANLTEPIRCKKAVGYDDRKKRVRYCGGRLRYSGDFSSIVCTKCGAEFLPLEFRPKDKEDKGKMANAMTDGMSFDEREEMLRQEVDAIKKLGERTVVDTGKPQTHEEPERESDKPAKSDRKMFVKPDDDTSDVEVFELKRREVPVVNEDDDDDDEPSIENVVMAYDGSDPEVDKEESGDPVEHVDPSLEITVIDPSDDNDDEVGVYIILNGDPIEALSTCALPMYVMLSDNENPIKVLSKEAFANILRPLVEDAMDGSEDAIHGE